VGFLVLLITAWLAALGASVYVVPAAAIVLTGLSAWRKVVTIAHAHPPNVLRVLSGRLIMSLAINAVFSLLAFLLGRAVAALVKVLVDGTASVGSAPL
jgi:hypothetical protein